MRVGSLLAKYSLSSSSLSDIVKVKSVTAVGLAAALTSCGYYDERTTMSGFDLAWLVADMNAVDHDVTMAPSTINGGEIAWGLGVGGINFGGKQPAVTRAVAFPPNI